MKKEFAVILFGGLVFMPSCSTEKDSNDRRPCCMLPSYSKGSLVRKRGDYVCPESYFQENIRQSSNRIKALTSTNTALTVKIQRVDLRKSSIAKVQNQAEKKAFNDSIIKITKELSNREKLVGIDIADCLAAIGLAQKENKFRREIRTLEKNVRTMREQLEKLNANKQAIAGLTF